jgi:hypothetical protein
MAGFKDLGCYQTYALRTINYKHKNKIYRVDIRTKQR